MITENNTESLGKFIMMDIYMKVYIKMINLMDLEDIYGQMGVIMKDNGEIILSTDKVNM